MPAAPADGALYSRLLGDEETRAIFTDGAELHAMLLVEGALARAQGKLGIIPVEAAAFIAKRAGEVQIDPAALSAEVARDGVSVPALLSALRKSMDGSEHAQYLHWGATSQDIVDTALVLRLRRLLDLWDARLVSLTSMLGGIAREHAELPMAGRTYGQIATPTSFGSVVATWGRPILRHRARLAAVRDEIAVVSLGGAAGTLSAMGPRGAAVRAVLAEALGLADPGASWHSERDRLGLLAGWISNLAASLGKMGEDLVLMCQSGIEEVSIAGAGGSSTMPQKRNPVGASVLVALSRHAIHLAAGVQDAAIHRQQRDGSAWFLERLTLPQLCFSTGRALSLAVELATHISPDRKAMAKNLDDGRGLVHAEALSFALASQMPLPEAQSRIRALCAEAIIGPLSLQQLVARDFAGFELETTAGLGCAPHEARDFAESVVAMVRSTVTPAFEWPVQDD